MFQRSAVSELLRVKRRQTVNVNLPSASHAAMCENLLNSTAHSTLCTDRHKDTHTYRQTDNAQPNIETVRQTDSTLCTDRHKDTHTYRQTDRHTQPYAQPNIETVRQTDSTLCTDHRSIYKYLDGELLSLSIDQMRAPQTQLSCPACITLTHARQPNLSSVRKFQNEISLGRRAHVRKMFVSLTHSPDSAYNIHICNKV